MIAPNSRSLLEPFFLDTENGRRFCLYHAPANTAARETLLYLHPFAEEMNKSRRAVALAARALAQQGVAVLQIDLFGCGDSEGDFDAATWQTWQQDVRDAAAWLRQRSNITPGLWGLRLGATLATQMAADVGAARLLLCQPVANGEQFLTQFLRLKVAREMFGEAEANAGAGGVTAIRQQLQQGGGVEIAGYPLGAALAQGISSAQLSKLPAPTCEVHWLEIAPETTGTLTPAAQRIIDQWRAAGASVHARSIAAEQFWATVEIAEAPAFAHSVCETLQLVSA